MPSSQCAGSYSAGEDQGGETKLRQLGGKSFEEDEGLRACLRSAVAITLKRMATQPD